MRAFVSFSSRDLPQVREVMTALDQQGIACWDYSNEVERIEAGTVITDRLRDEIDGCDLFIALVSSNSTDPTIGRFTAMEVAYAIDRGLLAAARIIPVRLVDKPNAKWSGPYGQLDDRLHLEFKLVDAKSYVRMSEEICRRAGVTYVPPVAAHHRLPFWEEFRAEVRELPHQNNEHKEMMSVLGIFNEHMRHEQYDDARRDISHFLSLCGFHLRDTQVFYPWLAKAVCDLHQDALDDAVKAFEEARKIRPKERNVFAGLALIHEMRGELEQALKYRGLSLEHATPDNKRDERINLAMLLLRMGRPLPQDLSRHLQGADATDMDREELAVLRTVQAQDLYKQGRKQEAFARFTHVEEAGHPSATTVQMRSRCRFDQGDHAGGIAILEEGIRRSGSEPTIDAEPIRHELAVRRST